MNVYGFLNEQMPNNICSKPGNDLLFDVSNDEIQLSEEILAYLEGGSPVISYTLALFDEEKNYIGPYHILTDGSWIWPSYIVYYLRKYKIVNFPKKFIDHIEQNGYRHIPLNKELVEYVQYFCVRLFKINLGSNWKMSQCLTSMINKFGDEIVCY